MATEDNKKLLLVDLSARLQSGVKCCFVDIPDIIHISYPLTATMLEQLKEGTSNFKPYLRPLSSMTEEEKEDLMNLTDCDSVSEDGFGYNEGGTMEDYISSIPFKLLAIVVDWLNAHYFDFRGLIPLGLALEALKDMYTK